MATPKTDAAEQPAQPEQPAEAAPEAPPPEEPMPTTVIQALARVMREIPGIGKDDKAAPEQGAYAYRGIESITRHAQQLLGRYGVVPILRETGYSVTDITVNAKPWTDTFLIVEYDFYGPGGPDDMITVGPIHVQGRDNSDKGPNKCRTQAFKYALLQTLCIGDGKDDSDAGSPEADRKSAPPDPAAEERQRFRRERIDKLTPEQRDLFRAWADEKKIPRVTGAWTDEQLEQAHAYVDTLVQEQQTAPPPEEDPAAAAQQQDHDAEQPQAPAGAAEPETPSVPFDVEALMAEASDRTSANDFQWVLQAPEDLVGPVSEEVKGIPKDELNSRLTASGLPTTGNDATKRQRLAARIVRLRMERMAGISLPASAAPEGDQSEAPADDEAQDEPEGDEPSGEESTPSAE
jgi:hypothetical protein